MATQVWQKHDVNIGLTYTHMSDRARVDVCEIVATSDLLTYFFSCVVAMSSSKRLSLSTPGHAEASGPVSLFQSRRVFLPLYSYPLGGGNSTRLVRVNRERSE